MAGPWDQFQTQAPPASSAKPWEQFQQAPQSDADQARAYIDQQSAARLATAKQAGEQTGSDIAHFLPNVGAGLLRGAGSIGATLLAPWDMARDAIDGKGLSLESNRQRRASIDNGLREMGANPESVGYKGGQLGGELAGTAGVGPALGAGARIAGASPRLVQALSTSGMTTGGPASPGIIGRAADLGIRSGAGAVTGGASAALVNPDEAGTGAAIGGLLPPSMALAGAAGRGLGRLVSGGPVKQEVRDLANRAQQLGIDIPADRIANSRPLNAIAAGLNYVPLSGRAATEEKMQSQLNRALSRTFGQDSDNVTQSLRKAQSELGDQFDTVLRSNTVHVDSQFLNELADAEAIAQRELGSDQAGIITKQIDEIMSKGASGQIDGQAAYNIKKTLDRIGKRNSPEAYYAGDLRKSLMGALNRSLTPDAAAGFATTRQQYGNMLDLQKLAQNGVDGDVSIARIANMKNINNQDMQELADIAAQFLKPREGQHGAAQRAAAGLGIGSIGGPATLAASIGAGRMTNSVLNSQTARNLLLQQLQAGRYPGIVENAYRMAPVLGSQ